MITKRCLFLMMILIPALVPTLALAQQSYTENFSTTTYMDAANTTAFWDTTAGELKLEPFVPTLAGDCATPDYDCDVAISGDLAFVASYASGLHVIDISDPETPVLLGTCDTPGNAFGVAVLGDHAFVADETTGLQVIDISDPATPVILGTCDTPGNAAGVAVAGDHAFVADEVSGLQVIDISDPTTPVILGSYDTPGIACRTAVAGDHAFVADQSGGLQVIDISDPTIPVLAGSCATPDPAYGVAVAGDHAYIAAINEGLQVIDISDPTIPAIVSNCATTGDAYDVTVAGDRAYVADYSSGLQMIDISDPANPSIRHNCDMPGHAMGVDVSGNHAFLADHSSNGLQVIKISEPAPIDILGTCNTSVTGTAVEVSGDYAYTVGGYSGLRVVDVSDPENPAPIGSGLSLGSSMDVALAGDHAFVADHDYGLQVIDISDPENAASLGICTTPGNARGVTVAGDLAYVADYNQGLQVIDISDPSTPVIIGSCATPDQALDVAVAGDHVFVADGYSGLQVIDISDPTTPVIVGSVGPALRMNAVTLSGDHAFVADNDYYSDWGLLQVIDISDPTNPAMIGADFPAGRIYGLAVSGDRVFVADTHNGMQVFDITDPTNPSLTGSIDGLYYGRDVAVSGEHVFLSGDENLHVIQVFQSEVTAFQATGQSLAVDGDSEAMIRTRLTSTETAGVSWEVSVDADTNWSSITADTTWARIDAAGDDLHWRSIHDWSPGVNPTVSDLTLEWLNEFGPISSVDDVPDDQGGWVRVHFTRSGYDFADEASLPVVGYNIYRRVDGAAPTTLIGDSESLETNIHYPLPGMKITSMGDRFFVHGTDSTSERAGTFPPGNWEIMTYVAATQSDNYQVSVPTLAGTNTFLVTTHTTTPAEWFVSPTATGESIDNLAPGVPVNLLFSGPDILSWDEAPEPDFAYHTVYGSENPVFDPSATLIGYTIDQSYDVSGSTHGYYHLTTSDHAGNESGAANVPSPGGTVSAAMTCLPFSGTLPFTTTISVELANSYTGQSRRIAGRLDVALAGGGFYGNWRAGWANVAPESSYSTNWNQNLPALGSLVGSNVFTLTAADVTPAPYNQPPYPAAGDTDTAQCTVVGNAP